MQIFVTRFLAFLILMTTLIEILKINYLTNNLIFNFKQMIKIIEFHINLTYLPLLIAG